MTANKLAHLGIHVVVVGRNQERGKKQLRKFEQQAKKRNSLPLIFATQPAYVKWPRRRLNSERPHRYSDQQYGTGGSTGDPFRGASSGVEIVVITPELERYTRALHKKLNLTFDMLTDLHLKTAEEYRVVFTLPDYLCDLYKSFGNALDRFHDESQFRLPIPARYVIDKHGIIRATDVNADYTIRPEPAKTLQQLRLIVEAAA